MEVVGKSNEKMWGKSWKLILKSDLKGANVEHY
jgi:hypothetical protein